MHSRKEKDQAIDNSFIPKTMEEKLDEAIEAMNKGDVRNFDGFMNDLKKKIPIMNKQEYSLEIT